MTNTHTHLLDTIDRFAGSLRAKTFRAAAEWVLQHDNRPIVETGTFHGDESQGNSTFILGLLAKAMNTTLYSVDLNEQHSKIAQQKFEHMPNIQFRVADSVRYLSGMRELPVLLYLDSYDHDAKNPLPCQIHQCAEIGAAYGKLVRPCAVLLDDNAFEDGGKTALTKMFLEERGWKKVIESYQVLYVLE